MCLLSFLMWGSIGYSLGIVQWDFTRQDHLGNPGRVSGSGPVISGLRDFQKIRLRSKQVGILPTLVYFPS